MSSRKARRGFVLPGVLVLLTLAALVVADALVEATTSAALGTRLQLRQRAFEAAQSAIDAGEAVLAQGPPPVPLPTFPDEALRTRLEVKLDRSEPLVAGFSAGRFEREHLRLMATAEGPRAARLALDAGYARWKAAP